MVAVKEWIMRLIAFFKGLFQKFSHHADNGPHLRTDELPVVIYTYEVPVGPAKSTETWRDWFNLWWNKNKPEVDPHAGGDSDSYSHPLGSMSHASPHDRLPQ